jgi:hypothetical protein
MIEDVVLLWLAPMPETGSSSRGCLELLGNDLIDLALVSLSMELWRRMENWIKVRCKYPGFASLSEC